MITSVIEILELPNFGHITTSTISFEPKNCDKMSDKILLETSWTGIMTP